MPGSVLVLGAGASGLACAVAASARGLAVTVLDANPGPGRKLAVCGGGKANFTNRDLDPARDYRSANPAFAVSALRRFGPGHLQTWMADHGFAWEERDHGRLFGVVPAREIACALEQEARNHGAIFAYHVVVDGVSRGEDGFAVTAGKRRWKADAVVVATGGPAWPQGGASDFGHQVARSFGLDVVPVAPGLVPLVYDADDAARLGPLAGLSLPVVATCRGRSFADALLFTHQGMSGPAILQVSNAWQAGDPVVLDLSPGRSMAEFLASERANSPTRTLAASLARHLPRRLAEAVLARSSVGNPTFATLRREATERLIDAVHRFTWTPAGKADWRQAEVTMGGVDTRCVSSRSFEARDVPGLYFVGEVLDVTGQLGGYNLQWAFASGFCAGGGLTGA